MNIRFVKTLIYRNFGEIKIKCEPEKSLINLVRNMKNVLEINKNLVPNPNN